MRHERQSRENVSPGRAGHPLPEEERVHSSVQTLTVTEDEEGMRLDRWFKRRLPTLSLSHLNKIVRTGQVRVDGARAQDVDAARRRPENARAAGQCRAAAAEASKSRKPIAAPSAT